MLQISRQHPALAAFSLTYLVCLAAYGFIDGKDNTPVYLAFMACAFVGVSFAHARIGFSGLTLWGLALWGLAHMLGGLVMAGDEVLYGMQLVPGLLRFDQAVHAFGFGFGTLAAWEALRPHLDPERERTPGPAVIVALAGMGAGALNEVVEFLATRVLSETNVGGFENTGWDLVFNTVGASAAAVLIHRGGRGVVADSAHSRWESRSNRTQ
jgi:hypothetical protein